MSQENVEIVRRAIEASHATTGGTCSRCYDPEVEYTTQPDAPCDMTHQGLHGLSVAGQRSRVWDELKIEAERDPSKRAK